jgi:hypothetical protein
MYSLKPDYEKSKMRMDAFWERELIDRPLVQFQLNKPANERLELPVSGHATLWDKMIDAEFQAEWSLAHLSNQLFLGDTMPVAWPNLGPEIMAACYGCPMQTAEYNVGSCSPCFQKIADTRHMMFNWNSPYLNKLEELTDAFLEIGKGKFITGVADWHNGTDCLANLVGSMNLATALINDPNQVKASLAQIEMDHQRMYRNIYKKLKAAGQAITTWVPLVSDEKYYVVSNDYSAMVSDPMYRDLFLEGVVMECQFLDKSIYHLDGPDALRHLNTILEIGELDGVQFVPPPGKNSFRRWSHVYRRIQAAGKCIQVTCDLSEVEAVTCSLRPEGLCLVVQGVKNEDEAKELTRMLDQWTIKKYRLL